MKIAKSSDVPRSVVEMEEAKNVQLRWLISKDDGADNFVMRMFELEPGGHTPLHVHPHEHEVFVIEGQGIFIYEGKEHEFCSDYVIFVPGNKQHSFKNTSDSILRFLCLIPATAV